MVAFRNTPRLPVERRGLLLRCVLYSFPAGSRIDHFRQALRPCRADSPFSSRLWRTRYRSPSPVPSKAGIGFARACRRRETLAGAATRRNSKRRLRLANFRLQTLSSCARGGKPAAARTSRQHRRRRESLRRRRHHGLGHRRLFARRVLVDKGAARYGVFVGVRAVLRRPAACSVRLRASKN